MKVNDGSERSSTTPKGDGEIEDTWGGIPSVNDGDSLDSVDGQVAVVNDGNRQADGWSSGAFSCFEDIPTCCAVAWCGPITTAQIFTRSRGAGRLMCVGVAALLFLGVIATRFHEVLNTGRVPSIITLVIGLLPAAQMYKPEMGGYAFASDDYGIGELAGIELLSSFGIFCLVLTCGFTLYARALIRCNRLSPETMCSWPTFGVVGKISLSRAVWMPWWRCWRWRSGVCGEVAGAQWSPTTPYRMHSPSHQASPVPVGGVTRSARRAADASRTYSVLCFASPAPSARFCVTKVKLRPRIVIRILHSHINCTSTCHMEPIPLSYLHPLVIHTKVPRVPTQD